MNTVSDEFHRLAGNSVRPLDWEVGISWAKSRDDEKSWFILDQSELDGADLLSDSDDNPIQLWDYYDYEKSKDRIVSLNVERSIEFPHNVQSAIADIKLNNYDGYYSFDNPASPLAQYILPSRPIRAYLGFQTAGVTPVFVGLTESIPKYTGTKNEVAEITAIDFLASIGDMSLKNMVMMVNARTDQVIAAILAQFGMTPAMYNLDHGVNVIPFVYFESGKNAGNALKELVQAENGSLWIDEQGIIRFQPRTAVIGKLPVLTLSEDGIVSIKPSATGDIVNTISISADIRRLEAFQPIFTSDNENGYDGAAKDDNFRIPAGGSRELWFTLEDPCYSASPLVFNGPNDDSYFTALNLSGSAVTSGLSASDGTLFADSYKVTINNTNTYPVSLNYIQLWGEPAKIVGESPSVKYYAYDEDSVEKFGVKKLEITDNKCFGSYENIDSFAESVLAKYKDYNPTIDLEIRGDPALQLQDIVTISEGEYAGDWMIIAISHKLESSKLTTNIKLRKHTVVAPFILDESELNGPDVLG